MNATEQAKLRRERDAVREAVLGNGDLAAAAIALVDAVDRSLDAGYPGEELSRWQWNQHKNDRGYGCRAGGLPITDDLAATGDGRCLHNCPDSRVERIRYRFVNHSNDIGDWCPWSGKPVVGDRLHEDDPCPAMCRASRIEEVPAGE